MAWAIARQEALLRRRPLDRDPGAERPDAGSLSASSLDDPTAPVPEECHLTLKDGAIAGRVTSAAYSETLKKTIGLAYVAPDQAAIDSLFDIKVDKRPHHQGARGEAAVLRSRRRAAGDVSDERSRRPPAGRARGAASTIATSSRRARASARSATAWSPPTTAARTRSARRASSASPTSRRCRAPASRARASPTGSRRRGVALGAESNRAYPAPAACSTARLAPSEVLILGPLDGDAERRSPRSSTPGATTAAGVWPVPRRDASFWFIGDAARIAPAMFAKICGVDLRPKSFANHAIAQTSVARTNAIVIRDDLGDVLAFHLLGDSASAALHVDVAARRHDRVRRQAGRARRLADLARNRHVGNAAFPVAPDRTPARRNAMEEHAVVSNVYFGLNPMWVSTCAARDHLRHHHHRKDQPLDRRADRRRADGRRSACSTRRRRSRASTGTRSGS